MATQSTSNKNSKTKPRVSKSAKINTKVRAEVKQALQTLKLNSALVSRAAIASALGESFGGKRDLYETLGYKKQLTYQDYLNAYERDGLATRIVDDVSDETWRLHPVFADPGVETTDEYDQPSLLQQEFSELADRLDIWSAFNDVDALCGISRFGLIYLGLPGNTDEEIKDGDVSADDLKFISVYDEGSADIARLDLVKDPNDERFGLPLFYNIKLDEEIPTVKRVHWTRVIHVKEGRSKSRVYGIPRLKPMFNRIMDMEKVVGSSSEAFYQLIYRGIALEAREGYSLPDKDSADYKNMQTELDEYEHGLRRFLRLSGMEAKDLGGKPVDGDEQFNLIVAYLGGSSHIPQRRLIGSERGELASSQDDYNFNAYIVARQKKFAEPYILRATVKRLNKLGILTSVPEKYEAEWPSLFELTDKEKMDIAVAAANAIATATSGAPEMIMEPEEFGKKYLDYVKEPEDELEQIEEALAPGNSLDKIIAKAYSKGSTTTVPPMYDVNRVKSVLGGNGSGVRKALQPAGDRIRSALMNNVLLYREDGLFVDGKNYDLRVWHNEIDHSAMIALKIPDVFKEELQKRYPFMDNETKDNLHITLVYLGDSRTLDVQKTDDALKLFCEYQKPIKTKLQGLARFVNSGEKDPVVCTFDSPDFPELFERLCSALDHFGIPYHQDHGFIPHMTLTYIGKDKDMPVETIEPIEMNFAEVYFVSGGEWNGFNLNGAVEEEAKDGQY